MENLEQNGGEEMAPNQERVYSRYVALFHVVAVAPLLIYVGLRGRNSNPNIFALLLTLGIAALVYHAFRFMNPRV
jgi:hypothetical protein